MYIELGKVVGAWGVKGWIKLHSYTRQRTDIANYRHWWLQPDNKNTDPVAYEVLDCREQGRGIVAQLVGVTDRDQALALNGQQILIDEHDLPELPEGEYYWHQLIGLEVCNRQDEMLGRVESIIETGANDVLVLKKQGGGKQDDILVPYTKQVVISVNLQAGSMIVDWDPAFLE